MPVMCANVARGKLIDDIEGHVNKRTPQRKQELKDLLKGLRNSQERLADLLVQHNIVGSGDPIRDHLNAHWFDPGPSNWWPHNQNKEAVVRYGLIEAIEILKDDPSLSMSIVWVCAGHHFQVAIHKSDVQVTVLLLTPHTPYGIQYQESTLETGLSVVGTKREIDQIVREAKHAGRLGRPDRNDCVKLATGVWKATIFGA